MIKECLSYWLIGVLVLSMVGGYIFHCNNVSELKTKIELANEKFDSAMAKNFLLQEYLADSVCQNLSIVENDSIFVGTLINVVNENNKKIDHILTTEYDARIGQQIANLNNWITIWVALFSIITIAVTIITIVLSQLYHRKELENLESNVRLCEEKFVNIDRNLKKIAETEFALISLLTMLKDIQDYPIAILDDIDRSRIIKRSIERIPVQLNKVINSLRMESDLFSDENQQIISMLLYHILIAVKDIKSSPLQRGTLKCCRDIEQYCNNTISTMANCAATARRPDEIIQNMENISAKFHSLINISNSC